MIQRCLFFLWFACLACLAAAQPLPALIPYTDGKLWGYCDSNGVVKIAPQWDEANFFEDGRAVVHVAQPPSFALIDTKGAYIIPPDKYWTGYLPDWSAARDITTEQKEWAGNRPPSPSLNIRDSSGRWGLIDANGKLVIPIEWEGQYGIAPEFYYNSYLQRFMLLGVKHGKYGLTDYSGRTFIPAVYDALYPLDSFFVATVGKRTTIIDVYNRRILLKSYDQLTPYNGFALVSQGGKTGAVAYPDGEVVVPVIYDAISPLEREYSRVERWKIGIVLGTGPFGNSASPSLFKITQNGKSGIIELPSARIILPLIYSDISLINDSMFIVLIGAKAGIVNRHNHYVVRPKYSMIGLDRHSSQLLVLKRGRYQLWDIKDMQPMTGWKKVPEPSLEAGYMNRLGIPDDYGIIRPKIRINGKDTNRFIKDGFEWLITANPGSGNYAVEGAYQDRKTPGTESSGYISGRWRYLAIVDTGLRYIAGPYRYDLTRPEAIEGYNAYDSLIIIKKYGLYESRVYRRPDSFRVMNTGLQPLFSLQPFPVRDAFRWGGHVYMLIFTYQPVQETGYGTKVRVLNLRTDYTGAKVRLSRDDSGFVRALEPYNIIRVSDRYGGETAVFRGCFLATDSSGNVGIVDIAGRVQLPGVSFRFPSIDVIANGLFLLPGKGIVDSTGNLLFPPAVAVQSVSPARRWHNSYRRQDTDLPYPIFRVAYSIQNQRGYFYMDSKGHAYIAREALSP